MRRDPPDTDAKSPSAVHRRLVEHVQAGQLELALALVAIDSVDHRGGSEGDHRGRDAWREKWERTAAPGVPKSTLTIEQNVAAGEFSVNRYTILGADSSGRRYQTTGMDMVRVKDGQVIEHWAFVDVLAMRLPFDG